MDSVRLVGLVLVSGVLLQLSFPPANIGLFIVVGFFPALYALKSRSSLTSLISGAAIGLCWQSQMPLSLLSREMSVILVPWVLSGLIVGGCLFATHHLKALMFSNLHWLAFPMLWAITTELSAKILLAPIALAPALAFSNTEMLAPSAIIGSAGLEFILAIPSSLLAQWFSYERSRSSVVCAFILCAIFLYSYLKPESKTIYSPVRVYGIQPSISHKTYTTSSWSLSTRSKVESIFDDLTASAIEQDTAGIVLWPESGNGLVNTRLQRRITTFQKQLRNSDSEIWVTGLDIDDQGNQFNAVAQISRRDTHKISQKNIVVPYVEDHYTSGTNSLFEYGNLRGGIAICFEALFSSHIKSLVDRGANAIIVLTNDSSFGDGYLSTLHAAYAITRTVEVQKPLVFLNNNGISLVSNPSGKIVFIDTQGSRRGIYMWDVEPVEGLSLSMLYGESTFQILLIGGLLYAASRPRFAEAAAQRQSSSPVVILIIPIVVAIGSIVALSAYAHGRGLSFSTAIYLSNQKAQVQLTMDGMSKVFSVRDSALSGTASLAYLLTQFGDRIFTKELTTRYAQDRKDGYSWSILKRIALNRGFNARVDFGESLDELNPVWPSIVRSRSGEYLVLSSIDVENVYLFDPAKGENIVLKRTEFEYMWSGQIMAIFYQ